MEDKSALKVNDGDVALRIAAGDILVFQEFFNQYRNKVFSIAWKFTSDTTTAEDMVQDIFLKIWVNREKLTGVDNMNLYLNAVVRNHVLNHLRKEALEQKMRSKISGIQKEIELENADEVGYRELKTLVQHAIDQLPPQQKRAYLFSREQGLKHEEIAARMGISRSTVKGHIVEALNSIRRYLTANGEVVGAFIFFLLI